MGDAAEKQEDQDVAEALRAASRPANDGTAAPQAAPEFMNIDEAADLLRISPNTMREVIGTGELPWAKRIGKQVRISRTALLKWFESEIPTKKRGAR